MFELTSKLRAFLTIGLVATPSLAFSAETATANLIDASGKPAGTVRVTDTPKGVLLHIEAKGLTPGWHGIHFHEKGDCAAPKFTSAGAHVHTAKSVIHGVLNDNANDFGDLTNIYAAPDGSASAEIYSTFVSLRGASSRAALLDADGSSVVIHAQADDYKSQPIGGSGARVACGVLKQD
ncbi:superoxide dismutase[Cu-Zn] [Gluconobacter thailandicus]|uniref:Superoxide dismutase family protein n=1 Tax=Gluconobacter thailandicus TaxID=257438 RepID=A0AAP9EPZ6_GLUTH|nr:superoxide dismutase family protein [Gluconobacter thailandicus]QEH95421.1 superoxide dismutase family protein [Gluconobacter thailandicus]